MLKNNFGMFMIITYTLFYMCTQIRKENCVVFYFTSHSYQQSQLFSAMCCTVQQSTLKVSALQVLVTFVNLLR